MTKKYVLKLGRKETKLYFIVLTIPAHARGHALLESAVLASVPVDALDVALLVLGARAVVDLLLDGPTEESLKDEP